MIDASKSGLFDKVVVPEMIHRRFNKRPQFMFYKDGNKYNKDESVESALDFLANRMTQFKEYVNKVMVEKTNQKIKKQSFQNIYNYLMNQELDGEIVQKTIDDLNVVYFNFIQRNRNLAILKGEINPYSSDDKYKREREIVDQKFKELYEKTKMEAEKICGCPSLLATAAVRMTYINTKYNNQNENYSFCWVVASEGILQNIKIHEDKEKIYVVQADDSDVDVFEWLGEYYKTQVSNVEYPLSFDDDKNMSIPEEYLKKEKGVLPDVPDVKLTIMNVEKGRAEEIAAEMQGNSYPLFENEKGWLGIKGDMSIKEKETLSVGIDLRKYIGHDVTIKEIITAKNSRSVIKVVVSIKGS
ncbi:hypothetical protein SDC9_133167 [bioreactor metagenome]|uniref:RDRP C-terminal head domain-containing protein n=1 Tax=bioreactor metagenome TaxID=1076179 RepID=A0A645D9R9_9ZZZZ